MKFLMKEWPIRSPKSQRRWTVPCRPTKSARFAAIAKQATFSKPFFNLRPLAFSAGDGYASYFVYDLHSIYLFS